jgi:hypothetical protein
VTAAGLLASLRDRGVVLEADGDRLRYRPREALTIADVEALWHGWHLDEARHCLVLRLRPLVEVTLDFEDLRTGADRIRTIGTLAGESWFGPECQQGLETALAALLAGGWLR